MKLLNVFREDGLVGRNISPSGILETFVDFSEEVPPFPKQAIGFRIFDMGFSILSD